MDVWIGYTGLAVAFVILAAILTWVLIQLPGHHLIKAVLIPPVIWYGLALYLTAPNLMGWPSTQKLPENSVLLAVRVREPLPAENDPGAIYLWVDQRSGAGTAEKTGTGMNPHTFFKSKPDNAPRAYKIPYSRAMHEAIVQARKKLEATPGGLMALRRRRAGKGGRAASRDQDQPPVRLDIVNPQTLMPKTTPEAQPATPGTPPGVYIPHP